MSHVVTIQQASERLGELVRGLAPGDEIVLTENNLPIARIVADNPGAGQRRPGACKGMLEIVDEGDDLILEHFKDYLP